METLARWVINLFCGSILTFYGSALILLLIRPFIRSARALYFLYLIPFFKIASDFFFSSHGQWVYLSKESILLQPENSRTLSALAGYEGTYPFLSLKLHLQNGHLFSIGDIIAECFPPIILFIIFSFIILGTAISLFRLGYQIYRNLQWGYKIKRELIFWKTLKNTPIFLIDQSLKSPFTLGVWKPIIVFPKNIFTEFTFEEKKAVLAHEMGHVLWKDNLMQWVLLFLYSLFWFIPLKSKLLKKAYHYREIGCDKRCNSKHLAEAIYKTAVTTLPPAAIAFSTSFDRFHRALHSPQERKWIQIVSLFILLGGTLLILMSEFLPF